MFFHSKYFNFFVLVFLFQYNCNNVQQFKSTDRIRICNHFPVNTTNSRTNYQYSKFNIYESNNSIRTWPSSSNNELIQAIVKVIILVFLNIFVKYYVQGFVKRNISNSTICLIIKLLSKALTIMIAKIIIKCSLYPAIRTALKTLLIAGLKTTIKPVTKRIKKDKNKLSSKLDKLINTIVSIKIKLTIKIIALQTLWLVFDNHVEQTFPGLIFRVFAIITVKMAAKRLCKLTKKKNQCNLMVFSDDNENIFINNECNVNDSQLVDNSKPVNQILSFALQKLVTKLVKIPLIKILLE